LVTVSTSYIYQGSLSEEPAYVSFTEMQLKRTEYTGIDRLKDINSAVPATFHYCRINRSAYFVIL